MRLSLRTIYILGIISAALTAVAGLLLFVNVSAMLLVNLSGITASAMMLLSATKFDDKKKKTLSVVACSMLLFDMSFGASTAMIGTLASLLGAFGWPVFALAHILYTDSDEKENSNQVSRLVIIMGVVQAIASFISPSVEISAVIVILIGVVQGFFSYLFFTMQSKPGS